MEPDLTGARRVSILRSIRGVDRGAWDALDHGGSPFLGWGFLAAAEDTGALGTAAGWEPWYVTVWRGDGERATLEGAVAAFRKDHSRGEYIFDWAWAQGAARAGLPYYPKLVVAAPVTPATGPRLLLDPRRAADPEPVIDALVASVRDLADRLGCHSIHWLFHTEREVDALARRGFLPRASFQYHWFNRGYATFDEFLGRLRSRRRKQLRKERRAALAAVDEVIWRVGEEISAGDLRDLDEFYRGTVAAHGGQAYLPPGFFQRLHELWPRALALVMARRGGGNVAGALYMESERALYGRYWGARADLDKLHFELACYQGQERAIETGRRLFEAGAQGEHKLLRGFEPTRTYSSHWIRDPRLGQAVAEFIRHEAQEVARVMTALAPAGPYRRDA